METRQTRKEILNSATEQFLDHVEEHYGEDFTLGSVIIAGELCAGDHYYPTFWCSNENRFWQRGFFSYLGEVK